MRADGVCSLCNGRGPLVVSISDEYYDDHDDAQAREGCPECGRARQLLVRYVTKPLGYLDDGVHH